MFTLTVTLVLWFPLCFCSASSLNHCMHSHLWCLPSSPLLSICLPLSAFCLSHTHTQSDSTDTHSHLPTLRDNHAGWNVAQSPPCTTTTAVRACTPTQNYSGELEKPDVNLDSIWSKTEAPRLKVCYSDCFLNQLCTGTDRGGKKVREGDREGSGTSSRKSLSHYFPILCLHALQLLQGVFPSVH